MIILDTNAAIYYLQNDRRATGIIDQLRKNDKTVAISSITELELLSFPKLSNEDMLRISVWLNEMFIVPVESSITREAARLRRKHRLKTPDAIIAATASIYDAPLITRDRTFAKISDIKIILC